MRWLKDEEVELIINLDHLRDNQEGEEVTVVDQLHIIGTVKISIVP